MYRVYIDDEHIFGPFNTMDQAQEWVDNNCGHNAWEIIKQAEEPHKESMPPLNPREFAD